MKKIISAIDANTEAPINNPRTMSNELSALVAETEAAFELFEDAFEAMMSAPTLAKRRALARQVGPLLTEARKLMEERDTADQLHPEHVQLRSERLYHTTFHVMERICDWRDSPMPFDILNGPDTVDEAA
jgi:hypothetical protein